MSPMHQEYNKFNGNPGGSMSGPTVTTRYAIPLLSEPGTSWHYGTSTDWAGLLVMRLTKQGLEEYMKQNIWVPLGVEDATFWPERYPVLNNLIPQMTTRDPTVPNEEGAIVPFLEKVMILGDRTEELGGTGLFISTPSYLKVLKSLLVDDEMLLRKETTAMMFEPQLSAQSQDALQRYFSSKENVRAMIADIPENVRYDWGLGGMLAMDNINWGRRKGTMLWAGWPNLFWVCKLSAGLRLI